MKFTVKDIATAANVSPATVSNALNNRKGVSEEVKQLVLKVAKEMGYAKETFMDRDALRFVVFKRHGYVVSDTPFFLSLIEGIEKQSRAFGYELLISHANIKDADFKEVINSINTDFSSGIIVLATEMLSEDLELFRNIRVPVVLVDNCFRENIFDSVLINNTDAAYTATGFLIGSGHKNVGYLHSSVYINNFRFRKLGYLSAMEDYGLKADDRYELYLEPTMDGAYRDMKHLLESTDLNLPAAFFADNDIIAFGAMKAMLEKGITIPDDVSIIGFDDMPFCEMTNPRLTTVKVFKQDIGSIAVKRLMQKINGDEKIIQKTEVATELVIRDSHKKL